MLVRHSIKTMKQIALPVISFGCAGFAMHRFLQSRHGSRETEVKFDRRVNDVTVASEGVYCLSKSLIDGTT